MKKKNIVIAILLVLFTVRSTSTIACKKASSYSVQWYELTPEAFPTMLPTFETLGPVFASAFAPVLLPYLYAYCPPTGIGLADHEAHSMDKNDLLMHITTFVENGWNRTIANKSPGLISGYLAVAKNDQQAVVGFALFSQKTFREHMQNASFIEGSVQSQQALDTLASSVGDAVYVTILAVTPEAQGTGVGRALLFSVFEHCAHIRKIFLTTSANTLNLKAQTFYERLGFEYVLKIMLNRCDWGDFWREKRVYLYQR